VSECFPTSIRATLGCILSCVFVLLLASCAHHFTLTSPTQLSELPASRGINGGTYIVPTAWQYRGSHYGTHEFRYYYHTHNLLHWRRVTIPRRSTVLHFPEVAFGSEPQWQWVTLRSDTPAFHFSIFQPPQARRQ
jgi:hypothetical protein